MVQRLDSQDADDSMLKDVLTMLRQKMINLKHILPVTDFNRNTKEHIRWLKETGKPEVLTVNGQAEVVVQSAEGYQKLLDAAELSETLAEVRRGLAQAKRGEGRPMREFMEEFAKKHGISLK
jgi:PHD/YefM family antitoxin component YafN of YafNO toxin-antitoxin module